jgi:hypothetical protein
MQTGDANTHPEFGVHILGDGGSTRLIAGANDMIFARLSRAGCIVEDIYFDGNGYTGVMGVGIVPESMTQTTTYVNQSHCFVRRCWFLSLSNGIKMQPGPIVLGAESGCFFHRIENNVFNFCSRAIWAAASSTSASDTNRATRVTLNGNVYLRGNVGVHIERGTEWDLIGESFELMNPTYSVSCPDGVASPLATCTAIRGENSTQVANIRIYGGYSELATNAIVIAGSAVTWTSYEFGHNSVPDVSEAGMNRFSQGEVVLARAYDGSGSTNGARVSFGTLGDNGFLFDPDGDGSKTLALFMNSVEIWRIFNGSQRITQTAQTLTGPGAVSTTTIKTLLVTTGADALTLADGAEGQTKYIKMKTDGGDGTLTPSNLANGTTLTFNDAGDSAHLMFLDGEWVFMGGTATLA